MKSQTSYMVKSYVIVNKLSIFILSLNAEMPVRGCKKPDLFGKMTL